MCSLKWFLQHVWIRVPQHCNYPKKKINKSSPPLSKYGILLSCLQLVYEISRTASLRQQEKKKENCLKWCTVLKTISILCNSCFFPSEKCICSGQKKKKHLSVLNSENRCSFYQNAELSSCCFWVLRSRWQSWEHTLHVLNIFLRFHFRRRGHLK